MTTKNTQYKDGSVLERHIDPTVALGGPSLGTDSIMRTNANTIDEDITVPTGTNASSIGPITVTDPFIVIVEGEWVVL